MFEDVRREFRLYTDDDLADAFNSGIPIYFDTNIFRSLWRMHSRPQKRVVEILTALCDRTYLPYQVRYELAAQVNGPSVLNGIPVLTLEKALGLVESAFTELREKFHDADPLQTSTAGADERISTFGAEISQRHAETVEWFTARQKELSDLLGESPNVDDIKRGRAKNPLEEVVSAIFSADHLLPAPDDRDRATRVDEYRARITRDDPIGPGLTDAGKSAIDAAAGDYIMWREITTHCAENGFDQGFILVTEEAKADFWEEKQGAGRLRRVNPDIQRESIEQSGGPMYLMALSPLLSLAAPQNPDLPQLRALVDVATPKNVEWSRQAVSSLLDALRAEGRTRQVRVIEGAAERDGYISRAEIGVVLDWGEDNQYLTRFRMPADRIASVLVDEGILDREATAPLTAIYDGPGEAIGYQIPNEFVGIIADLGHEGV